MTLYASLVLVSAVLHISVPQPSPQAPKGYGLAACSAVFVSQNELLTAAHCIKEARNSPWLKISDGTVYRVSVEKKDLVRDLALVKVDKPLFKHEYVAIGSPIGITQRVYILSNNEDWQNTYNEGIVNNIIEDDQVISIIHNAAIRPGASGSGVFNSDKELVGINIATYGGLSEAVDVLEIKSFLNVR